MNYNGWTAFSLACGNGHKNVVQLLLNCPVRNTELNARDENRCAVFMIACYHGHKGVALSVQLLLDHSDSNIK